MPHKGPHGWCPYWRSPQPHPLLQIAVSKWVSNYLNLCTTSIIKNTSARSSKSKALLEAVRVRGYVVEHWDFLDPYERALSGIGIEVSDRYRKVSSRGDRRGRVATARAACAL